MKNILITTQMMIHDESRFRQILEKKGFNVDFLMNDQYVSEKECLEIDPVYDGWISGDDEITANVIDHMLPRLKVISKWGTGLDSIDKEYASNSGLMVRNSPGAFSDAVGEMAIAYLLALGRRIVETNQNVKAGLWPKLQTKTVNEMIVGFVGLGAIGSGAAWRAEALGASIVYVDPNVTHEKYKKLDDIGLLFNMCDAVIISSDLNKNTRGLINKSVIQQSGNGTMLINVGRGPIVVESDLIWGIKEGLITSAALDVFELEPLSENSPFISFDNVICGSHNANNTKSAVEFVHQNTIEQLCSSLSE